MKRSLLFGVVGAILLSLLAMSSRIVLAKEQFILTVQGWKIANDSTAPEFFATWTGDVKDSFPNGQGSLQMFLYGKLLAKYEGNMLNGYMNGKGILLKFNGDRVEGAFL